MNERTGLSVEVAVRLSKLLVLPDPDDRHVVAAEIVAIADVIVTFNLRDFPREKLEKCGIDAQYPDGFIGNLRIISRSICRARPFGLDNAQKRPHDTPPDLGPQRVGHLLLSCRCPHRWTSRPIRTCRPGTSIRQFRECHLVVLGS